MARLRIAVTGLVGLVVAASFVAPAHAAFPGANGRIAWQSDRDGNWEIYSANPDGSSPTNLTNHPTFDAAPAWSADGKKIAFQSFRDGNFEIYTMNANGTGQTRITNNAAADEFPAWSPDGTKIVFHSTRHDPNREVYTMNADGTNVVRLTSDPGIDYLAVWSPDGAKIAWSSSRSGGQLDIFKMNPDGTGPTNLTNNPASDNFPDWSPDGSKIVFDSDRDPQGSVTKTYEMNADGTGLIRRGDFTNVEGQSIPASSPVYAPANEGSRIALVLGPSNNIYVYSEAPFVLEDVTTNPADDRYPDWQPLVNSYARPVGATPLRVPLVPAYKPCGAGTTNSKHKGALTTPSCVPPTPESGSLTIGSPDFNGAPAKASGFVRMAVFCNGGAPGEGAPCLTSAGDQLDGKITVSQTDVRCQGTTGSCPGGALADYAGNLRLELSARVTDKNNGGFGAGTLQDVPLAFNVPCATTVDGTVGSTCSTNTSIDAVLGGVTAITEQKRAVWQNLGRVNLYDGGNDGVASTTGDNTLFATDGLYFP